MNGMGGQGGEMPSDSMDQETDEAPHRKPMKGQFEELDYQETPIGGLSLRRKKVLSLGGRIVYEVKVDEGFLMSSLFTDVEEAVAREGLTWLEGDHLDVVVGGLGLGYTAMAALENLSVQSLLVIESIQAVIGWHREKRVPLGEVLTGDERCRLIHDDFFAAAADPARGFDPESPGRRFHAILLDIDHTPDLLLRESHGGFYEVEGLQRLTGHLHPGGVFAMWSDGHVHKEFRANLEQVFSRVEARRVSFFNPLQNSDSAATLYLAQKESAPG